MAEVNNTTATNTTTETPNTDTFDYKAEYERLKASNDKLSSENATYKRNERERMTAEQQAQADLEAERAEAKRVREELAMLKLTSKLSSHYKDEKVASNIAKLFAEGEIDKAIDAQNAYLTKYISELKKTIEDELMANNPEPQPQGTSGVKTKADIMAIKDPIERQAEIAKHIDLFN